MFDTDPFAEIAGHGDADISRRFDHSLDIYGRQGRIGLRGLGFTYGVDVVSSALPAYSQPTSIQLAQMEDLRILMHQPQLAEFAQAIPRAAAACDHGERWAARAQGARRVHQV